MNILISCLGMQTDIIEETIGLFNYNANLDFYSGNPDVTSLRKQIEPVDELWLLATDHKKTSRFNSISEDFDAVKNNCHKYCKKIRIFILKGVSDIASEQDAKCFHDLTLRVVTFAKQQLNDGRLYLSLACGRKTMSTDIQDAAFCFGCDVLLHVLGEKKKDATPLLMGPTLANEALKTEVQQFEDSEFLRCEPRTDYLQKIEQQKTQAQHFYTTYYLDEKEIRSNFHILYTLPPSEIERLKKTYIGTNKGKEGEELAWLKRLPKTDLHCHLGGVLYPNEMIEVAKCYEQQIEEETKYNASYKQWVEQLNANPTAQLRKVTEWKEWLKKRCQELEVEKGLVAAAILLSYQNKEEELGKLIFKNYWHNEGSYKQIGIDPYEGLGDLQGSALLGNEHAIRKTVNILTNRCLAENVKYLEVRCSPINYENKLSGLSADKIMLAICEELDKAEKEGLTSSVIIIASRHGAEEKIKQSINLVYNLKGNDLFKKYFRGFDLAGDESAKAAKDMREDFMDIMKECYNITIHAGETMNSESIWEAVYYLSAERIGHGLKLLEKQELMDKLLERGIGVEMCPSSNYQINGYRDNYYPEETASLNIYPLRDYLKKELQVSINTDDPGISLTDCTHELLKAARMTEGGLSKWEVLQLICNGFRTAFYPYEKKRGLIRAAEKAIGELIRNGQL